MNIVKLILTIGATTIVSVNARAGEWQDLFDGRSFAGWEGNLDVFRIQDGCIVGGNLERPIERNEFLCTKETYADFELRLKVKVVGEQANAGIQFRTRRIPDHHEVSGYQADVGAGWWGKLYDESRRSRVLAGPAADVLETDFAHIDDWNEYVIRCEGRHIQLWLNGVQTVNYTEAEEVDREGVIAVQIHSGPPTEAWYREIRLKRLGD